MPGTVASEREAAPVKHVPMVSKPDPNTSAICVVKIVTIIPALNPTIMG